MKTVAIWGAASGLGAAMVEYFAGQGFSVIAIARDPKKNPQITELGLTAICCDATDQSQVIQTVAQLPQDALVISTMGSFRAAVPVDYIGHRYLIDSLEQANIKRFLLVTSLGCGDSWQYLSDGAKRGFGAAVREKSLAEAWLQSSQLDYTILRPGGLKDGPVTQTGELSQNQEVHGLITRSEVAQLAHLLISDEQSVGQIYACVDPEIAY
ncbi:SDR family NAD(P)-dependent oxidoreductase [Corallincola platygyrae]|uniref:SDR family NAD(P)-dependent oxidoreductase n=1 Tax=Corallincola platygyrae TaxID=1193278 RepID=A0ABW4XL30_9GAMM